MNDAHEGDLVTPRARSLALKLADDPGVRYDVERGDALRFVGRRRDGLVEVEYLQRRWVVAGESLQLLSHLTNPVTIQSEGLPGAAPSTHASHVDDDGPSTQADGIVATGELPTPSRPRIEVRSRLALLGAALVVLVALALLLVRCLRADDESLPSERAAPVFDGGRVATPATAPVVPVVPAATPAPPATPTPTPTSTPTPQATATPPVVSNLVVCDTTVDCGIAVGEFSRAEFLACLRVMPGGSGSPPLVLAATSADDPPAGAQGATVLARSEPVPQDPAFRCHPIRSTRGDLAEGRYWLWALVGTAVVGRVQFVVGPP